MALDPNTAFRVNYDRLMGKYAGRNLQSVVTELSTHLPHAWIAAYHSRVKRATQILEVTMERSSYLFDLASSVASSHIKRVPDDRVVVVWGRSSAASGPRDASRMKGFPRTGNMDRGHLVSHAQGGGLDINLVPQRHDVNRGWSPQGKEFRAMETYCAEHPGTFFFVRPLYGDDTWVPRWIEYGVLKSATELDVKHFPN